MKCSLTLFLFSSETFDLILSSETLYSLDTCEQVAYFLQQCLTAGRGVALLATKRFYFGVGGGTLQFQELCNSLSASPIASMDGKLTATVIQSFEDGHSNVRDIILVQKELY